MEDQKPLSFEQYLQYDEKSRSNLGETLPTRYTGGYSWGEDPHFEALTSESFEIISSRMTTLGVYSDMSSQWNNLDLRIVDVSGCPMLESLGCSWGNPKLEEIWLKKGQTTRVSCDSENVRILYK